MKITIDRLIKQKIEMDARIKAASIYIADNNPDTYDLDNFLDFIDDNWKDWQETPSTKLFF